MTATSIVPRMTIAEVVAKRDKALAKFETAAEQLRGAYDMTDEALFEVNGISTGSDFNYDRSRTEEHYQRLFRKQFNPVDSVRIAREIIDYDIWRYLMTFTKIDTLMDKQAKDELLSSLKENVPEVTVENVTATLESLYADSQMIFLRGIANVFSKLDRRFRSHNAWKLGSRIIITRAFDDMGYWNSYRNHEATLVDVERVFSQVDTGKATNTLVNAITQARKEVKEAGRKDGSISWGEGFQTFIETDYFKIRIFKNGNCHIWFTRDDLVTKVNKLIAQYYGNVIPDDTDSSFEEEVFRDIKTTPAKNYGFFPTPDPLVKRIFDDIYVPEGKSPTCLEPSAGTGQIALRAVKEGMVVDCVEMQDHLVKPLKEMGAFRQVYGMDFHKFDTAKRYDYIIMNPPFDRGRDIDHVMHAWKFLEEGGQLIAIMHAGIEFSNTRKAKAFRNFASEHCGNTWSGKDSWFRDLPQNSFSSVGTNVNTVLVKLFK